MSFGALDRRIASMARNAHSDLQPGQLVKQGGIAWEVVDFSSVYDIPHVQISMVGDPTERKLISLSALLDGYDIATE